MKISKVKVQRVYQIKQFENIRIEFEVGVEDNENPREVVLLVYNEILNMERVIAEFEYTKNDYSNLRDLVHDADYGNIFERYREKIKSLKDEKLKALGCLEQVDLSKIESIPTMCIEQFDIRTLKDLADRKEKLRKQIEEMDATLKQIDVVEKNWDIFDLSFNDRIREAKKYFVEGKYDRALEILLSLREEMKKIREQISEVNPEHYKYSWR